MATFDHRGDAGMPLRVVLADDHEIVRDGFCTLLESEAITIVGQAANGHEAVELARTRNPDIVLMDFSMPELNGLDAAREILQVNPQAKIIFLTMREEEHVIVDALRAGICGYVLKSQGIDDLVEAIQEVASGGTYIGPRVAYVVAAYVCRSEAYQGPLTDRERQVLQGLAEPMIRQKSPPSSD